MKNSRKSSDTFVFIGVFLFVLSFVLIIFSSSFFVKLVAFMGAVSMLMAVFVDQPTIKNSRK
ncbi:MAG: hypothetical protein L3J07_01740 [Candidatus Magasanikbacteria bacterium]|nr:hypothetical protein [Candidatus Magasanikbacteria bacterium]